MKKIVQTINSIITHESKINHVIKSLSSDGYYFEYLKKYKFYMGRNHEGHIVLKIYHEYTFDLESLARSNGGAAFDKFLEFTTKEYNSPEERESFEDLFNRLNRRVVNVDSLLDNIINCI